MDNKNFEDFILTLVRSLQSLCNGHVKYTNEVQVTGQLYLSVDAEETTEYVINEKLCKASSGKVDIISNSFYVQRTPTCNVENVNVKQELVDTAYSEVTNKVVPLLDVQSNASRLPLDLIGEPVKGISKKIQSTDFSDQQNNEKSSCTPDDNEISSNCTGTNKVVLEGVSDGTVDMSEIEGCMNSPAATNVKDYGLQIANINNDDNTLLESLKRPMLKKGKMFSVSSKIDIKQI